MKWVVSGRLSYVAITTISYPPRVENIKTKEQTRVFIFISSGKQRKSIIFWILNSGFITNTAQRSLHLSPFSLFTSLSLSTIQQPGGGNAFLWSQQIPDRPRSSQKQWNQNLLQNLWSRTYQSPHDHWYTLYYIPS